MKTLVGIILLGVCLGCGMDNRCIKEIKNEVNNWLTQNPRASKAADVRLHDKVLTVTIQDTTERGSPIIEEISADNLVYYIAGYECSSTLDSIVITIDINLHQVSHGKRVEKVLKIYAYSRAGIDTLLSLNGSGYGHDVSQYVSFRMSNADEHVFYQANNSLSDLFPSRFTKDNSGLLTIYRFAQLKSMMLKRPDLAPVVEDGRIQVNAICAIMEEAGLPEFAHCKNLMVFIDEKYRGPEWDKLVALEKSNEQ